MTPNEMIKPDKILEICDLIVNTTTLSETEKKILQAYYDGLLDSEVAKMLKIENKSVIRSKRQNICAKIGHSLIVTQNMFRSDWYKKNGKI